MAGGGAPFHAHIYYTATDRPVAAAMRKRFIALTKPGGDPRIDFVGRMVDAPIGPHPVPQFEVHFHGAGRDAVVGLIAASGLRALVHPLTNDDLADHTTLAEWIGEPLTLDISVLDPPGINRSVARFGSSDF